MGNDTEYCQFLHEIPVGVLAGGSIEGYSEIGVQQLEHLGQVALDQRFEYYEENYVINDIFGWEGQLVKIENIYEPPFKFLFVENDGTCSVDLNSEYAHKIPAFYSETVIPDRIHSYVVGDNDPEFFEILMNNLQHFGEPLSFKNC